jgi:hypothetical protein
MRPHTLSAHLSVTEDALRNERIRVADQLKLVRKLREEGRDVSATMEVLQSMKGTLFALARQRQLLLEQLGLFVPSPAPIHLNRHSR